MNGAELWSCVPEGNKRSYKHLVTVVACMLYGTVGQLGEGRGDIRLLTYLVSM